jgi:benzaldehyde dehydrogenase (NAD)
MNPQAWDSKLFLGGWVNSHQVAEVTDKATGEILAHVGVTSAEDVSKACEAAAKAAPAWAATPTKVRAAIVRRAGELLLQHRSP